MDYLSLFSGVGGLEASDSAPLLCCELDPLCRDVLATRFPNARLEPDVTKLRRPPRAAVVAGGWPCQDLSVAGRQAGLDGPRSGLFFELVRVAASAGASTVVAENVPRLLTLDRGRAFERVLSAFSDLGLRYVSWRTLNARDFGLPHQRRRVFLVASRFRETAMSLHRPLPEVECRAGEREAFGFYTTAGIQSICFSRGYVPTLKVGSSLSIPSPPGVLFDGVVRKATGSEVLRLQGFDGSDFEAAPEAAWHGMAGNAVTQPVGKFVMDGVLAEPDSGHDVFVGGFGAIGKHGIADNGRLSEVDHQVGRGATDLYKFLDRDNREILSSRAASGLLSRLERSGKECPPELRNALFEAAGDFSPGRATEAPTATSDEVPALF